MQSKINFHGLSRLRRWQRGVTGLAYALVIGLVAVVAIVSMQQLGGSSKALLTKASNAISGAGGASSQVQASPPDMLVVGNTTKEVTRFGWTARCTSWSGRTCMNPEVRPTSTIDWDTGACGEVGTQGFPRIFHMLICTNCDATNRAGNVHMFCSIATGDANGTHVGLTGSPTFTPGVSGATGSESSNGSTNRPYCAATGYGGPPHYYTAKPLTTIPGATYSMTSSTTTGAIGGTGSDIDCSAW